MRFNKSNKPIRLSRHARDQLEFRGISEEEEIVVVTVYSYYFQEETQ
jgi:hypothetical protein